MKGDPVGRILTDEAIADFRARLCEAAAAQLAEGGRTAVSMRQVAERLGVSAMTPYRYFESKQAMINAVRVRGFERLAKALEDAGSAAGPEDVGRALFEAYVAFASDNPAIYRLMFEPGSAGEGADPDLAKAVGQARAALTRELQRSRQGLRPASDAQVAGDLFWATLHGLLALGMAGKLRDCEGVRALAVATLSRGLADSLAAV